MKITCVPIEELIPDPENAREHDDRSVQAIAASLEKFGQRKPIVVRNNVVIAGNGTLAAATSLGWSEIEVVSADDLDDTDAVAFAIADNRTSELSNWDTDTLSEMMSKVASAPDLKLDVTGFASEEEAHKLAKKKKPKSRPTLADQFIVPPLSVLDGRRGYWQDRRRAWRSAGIVDQAAAPEVTPHMYIPGYYEKIEAGMTGQEIEREFADSGGKLPEDVSRRNLTDPVLAEVMVRWFSAPGDKILDCYVGDGVRAAVSGVLGRNYIGMGEELDDFEPILGMYKDVSSNVNTLPSDARGKFGSGIEPKFTKDVIPDGPYSLGLICPPMPNMRRRKDPSRFSEMAYHDWYARLVKVSQTVFERLDDHSLCACLIAEPRFKDGLQPGALSQYGVDMNAIGFVPMNECAVLNPIGSGAIRAKKDFLAGRKMTRTHAHMLVFCKGDWRTAVRRLPSEYEDIGLNHV